MLQKGVETLQSQVACFNMGSILIKPVQRILKYPLILNELIKVRSILCIYRDLGDVKSLSGKLVVDTRVVVRIIIRFFRKHIIMILYFKIRFRFRLRDKFFYVILYYKRNFEEKNDKNDTWNKVYIDRVWSKTTT